MKERTPCDGLIYLYEQGALDLYIIDSPPATKSTALARALAESPSIDLAIHEPFTGLVRINNSGPARPIDDDGNFQEICDAICGMALDIVGDRREKQPKARILIKTMANDLTPEQFTFLLSISKGVLSLVRNPQSQLWSFYKSYKKMNDGTYLTADTASKDPNLQSVFGTKLNDTGFAAKLAGYYNTTLSDHMDLLQMSVHGVPTDEPAWNSLRRHLEIIDRTRYSPHLSTQSELLGSKHLMEDVIKQICEKWKIEFHQNMVAEQLENGRDNWAKTAGDKMISGHKLFCVFGDQRNDPFAELALASRGWVFKESPVPSLKDLPEAMQQYIRSTADRVYFNCLDRPDMHGPKSPQMLRAIYGSGFEEIAARMEKRSRVPAETPDLDHFVVEGMHRDPKVQAMNRDLGIE